MLTKITGGLIYDPANAINGQRKDLYIRDGIIVDEPTPSENIDREYDAHDKVVMAGAIDLHTHIGGGKVNIARTMLTFDHHDHPRMRTDLTRSGSGVATPSTWATGYRYAEMGYTCCFEPAILPINARQAHMEMADTPMVDTGGYAMLGNDDFLLALLAKDVDQKIINDYVAWTLCATQCLGIKVVNPGGINAFKFNGRKLNVDEPTPYYGVTPRKIVRSLSKAIAMLGVPHPLHIHASNLGVPGNFESTLATIDAAEGHPIHLTHVQFHSYGTDGDRRFSSAAAQIAAAVKRNKNVSVDVGQIMFGQTVTVSADTMQQYQNHTFASPNKWVCMDIECEAGCGVVPFRYRDKSFVNALQWAIGLELFLMIDDPWRVFLTTDHPNGAPFVSYPHLIRLLMDRSYRNDILQSIIHPDAREMSQLGNNEREYSLYEIATMTRAAPARILGLVNQGHLGTSAVADITIYAPKPNYEQMFSTPEYVFKDGELVVHKGKIVRTITGRTHVVRPEYDTEIERLIAAFFDNYHTMRFANFRISDDEMAEHIGSPIVINPCHTTRQA